MSLTPFESFADEEREDLRKEAHKKYQDTILAENLEYNGINGTYWLTVQKDGFFILNYLPTMLHANISKITEAEIEKTEGEHSNLYRWVVKMMKEHSMP